MKIRRHNKASEQNIDISPLIDMVFILLIFFMVSTTFNKDLKLDLTRPQASSATTASTKAIKVMIDRNQNLFVDNQPVRLWVLQGKVREMLQNVSQKSVLVIIDKSVPSERLIEVVDQCKLAGAEDVGVATRKEIGV